MKKFDVKKGVTFGGLFILVVIVAIGGYDLYQQRKVQAVLKNMTMTFDEEKVEFEYGSEVNTIDLVKTYEGGELSQHTTLDTKQVGEIALSFTLEKDGIEKEFQQEVMIKDTQAPQIKIKSDQMETMINHEINIKENVESVTDVVDGEISINDGAMDINQRATTAYQSLEDKELDQVLIDDLPLSAFVVIEEGESNQLYLKNCYDLSGTVDFSKAGEYDIRVVAVDGNGLKSEATFPVIVKEAPKEEPSNTQTNTNTTPTQGPTTQNPQTVPQQPATPPLAPKGLDWMNKYAYSMIGQTGWDCGAFVTHVLKEAGYLSPSADGFWSGGTNISWQELKAGDVVYYERANGTRHAVLLTSDVFIDHTNGWSVYRWSVVQGGVGSSQAITYGSFDYDPDGNLPNNNYKFIYVKRYI